MATIRDQKLLYHLTNLNNVGSILESGLQPRSALNEFSDVADVEILFGRAEHGLDNYVPFHWFSRNPFDGRVQIDRPDEEFVLLTVRRSLDSARNWRILPRHPLARQEFGFYDYREGFDLIDWGLMDCRNYSDADCKSVCMAECLSPTPVRAADFFKIFVPTELVKRKVLEELATRDLGIEVTVNRGMFC